MKARKTRNKRNSIQPGDKVILHGLLRDGETPYVLEEHLRIFRELVEERQAEVIVEIMEYEIDLSENERTSQRIVALIHEHDAHLITFGVEDEFLFFPHGECRKGIP